MILHIDMDAFFAAIEQRDDPKIAGKPVIVGGNSSRSVVCTASYEARKFGIHSAMPVFKAKQKCSDLIIVPVHRAKYSENSKLVMKILNNFSPYVEQVSIDEAYVDISGCEKLFGSYEEIAQSIKQKIFDELNLTCSIGIAPLKFLAKIASDLKKPAGITIIEKHKAKEFALNLDIRKIPGVGKTAMQQMDVMQIKKLKDIHNFPKELLEKKFGKMGLRLIQLANGIDTSKVEVGYKRKSISNEITLSKDTSDVNFLKKKLLSLSHTVGQELRNKQLLCINVFIKLKFSDFSQITRTKKLKSYIFSSSSIYNEAILLLDKLEIKKRVRLIGVGVSSLRDNDIPVQMNLIQTEEKQIKQWEAVDVAVDSIAEKFGNGIIKKATLNS